MAVQTFTQTPYMTIIAGVQRENCSFARCRAYKSTVIASRLVHFGDVLRQHGGLLTGRADGWSHAHAVINFVKSRSDRRIHCLYGNIRTVFIMLSKESWLDLASTEAYSIPNAAQVEGRDAQYLINCTVYSKASFMSMLLFRHY